MLVGMPRRDRHELRLQFLEHRSIVRESIFDLQSQQRTPQPFFVSVGDPDDFGVRDLLPDDIKSVAIISPSRMSNHSDSAFRRIRRKCMGCDKPGRGTSEKCSAIHKESSWEASW